MNQKVLLKVNLVRLFLGFRFVSSLTAPLMFPILVIVTAITCFSVSLHALVSNCFLEYNNRHDKIHLDIVAMKSAIWLVDLVNGSGLCERFKIIKFNLKL